MSTNHFTISLPSSFANFIQAQVESGGYSSPEAYVIALVDAERRRKAEEALEVQLEEGLAPQEKYVGDADFWRDLKTEITKRHQPAKHA